MRILITSDWYSPAVNGVVTSVKNLRRELERRGHEVRVLTLSQNRRSWEKDGVTYLGSIAAGLVYPGARLRTVLAGKQVRKLISWRPDVVHSQCEFSTFFLARRIAEELDIPLAEVYGVVSFYTQFSINPKGKYQINVCMGTACYVKGASEILDKFRTRLSIDVGECTDDQKFSLDACRCIGACGLAPVVTINDEVYGKLTADEVDDILDKYEDR